MAFSVAATALVSLFTKAPAEEVLKEAFDKKIENEIV